MPTIENELHNALVARAADLLSAATTCLALADMPIEGHPSFQLVRIRQAIHELESAEALTATLFVRAGASWDSLATRFELSRQALHRRLAARGEGQYGMAQEYSDLRQSDLDEGCRLVEVLASDIGSELSDALSERANELAELRRIPHWWRSGE